MGTLHAVVVLSPHIVHTSSAHRCIYVYVCICQKKTLPVHTAPLFFYTLHPFQHTAPAFHTQLCDASAAWAGPRNLHVPRRSQLGALAVRLTQNLPSVSIPVSIPVSISVSISVSILHTDQWQWRGDLHPLLGQVLAGSAGRLLVGRPQPHPSGAVAPALQQVDWGGVRAPRANVVPLPHGTVFSPSHFLPLILSLSFCPSLLDCSDTVARSPLEWCIATMCVLPCAMQECFPG